MIEPYYVAVCQSEKISVRFEGMAEFKTNVDKNLQHYCRLIDTVCGGSAASLAGLTDAVKLFTFGEFAITGHHFPAAPGQQMLDRSEIVEQLAIKIPGEETNILADKARQWGIYIAAANFESDEEWPNLFFNTGFIINPEGKVILKYRKITTNVPIGNTASAHDVMDTYKDPITHKFDAFPVVDTSIGRLGIMICADLLAPEIPRIYSMKGADVVIHLTAGMSSDHGGARAPGVTKARIMTRASDNALYFVNSNWGRALGIVNSGTTAGYSKVYDYMGNLLVEALDTSEIVLRARIDIETARKYKDLYFQCSLPMTRTELYAPYYNKSIYPPNTFLEDGPIEKVLDDSHQAHMKKALTNLRGLRDFYKETDIP